MNRRWGMIAVLLLAGLSVPGCEEGPHLNKTHEGELLDNHVLQQRVDGALRRGGADYQNVQAHATNGTIVLTGSVSSPAARSRAEGIARGVYGVKDVRDEVRVAPQGR